MTTPRAGETVSRLVHAQETPGSTPGPATASPAAGVAATVAGGALSPAGIVKVPGVDDVLDALAREEDYVKDRAELFEGRQQTPGELAQWKRLFNEVQKESNKRLNSHNVHLFGCSPNPNGFGAVFIGFDSEQRRYDVTLAIPMEERRNQESAGRERFVRWMIDAVVSATLLQRENYLRRGGMAS